MVWSPKLASAADSIAFTDKSNLKSETLKTLLSNRDFNQIAEVDLNNDSIDEYVLERDTNEAFREFEVLALINERLIPLANIQAQKLMIAYDEQNGVRSILGFRDANNDYEYDIYAWDALHSRYGNVKDIKAKGGSQ